MPTWEALLREVGCWFDAAARRKTVTAALDKPTGAAE
jgi:hypothetical protein